MELYTNQTELNIWKDLHWPWMVRISTRQHSNRLWKSRLKIWKFPGNISVQCHGWSAWSFTVPGGSVANSAEAVTNNITRGEILHWRAKHRWERINLSMPRLTAGLITEGRTFLFPVLPFFRVWDLKLEIYRWFWDHSLSFWLAVDLLKWEM